MASVHEGMIEILDHLKFKGFPLEYLRAKEGGHHLLLYKKNGAKNILI